MYISSSGSRIAQCLYTKCRKFCPVNPLFDLAALAGAGLLQASPNAISPSWLASLAHRNFAQCNLRHPVCSPIGGSVSPDVVSKWLQPLRIISFSCSSSPAPPFCRFGEIQKLRSRLYHPCSSSSACQKSPETLILTIYDINTSNTDLLDFQ